MRAIKSYRILKASALVIVLFLGLFLIFFGQIPALPTSKPAAEYGSYADIFLYLKDNLFSIVFSIASLIFGLFIFLFGQSARRHAHGLSRIGSAGVWLGVFILTSGIWILTDSSALSVFTTEYGGILPYNAVSLVSFISFMLLPIVFLAFLGCLRPLGRSLRIFDGTFVLNLTVFVVLVAFRLPTARYLIFLLIHHALIYALMIAATVNFLRNYRNIEDKQQRDILNSVLLFMLFGGTALLTFLLGFPRLYVVIYSVGFVILVIYMIKITLDGFLSAYKESATLDLYKSLAYTDLLTDMKNRNAFRAEQEDRTVNANTCCVVVDINRLKLVNDTFGHHAGDDLIRRAAEAVRDVFSPLGVCYRIGGDEFAVVCTDTEQSSIQSAVADLHRKAEASGDSSKPPLSLACGYAFGTGGGTFAALFSAADKNMYLDKKQYAASRED